jgi:hypothetical protein
LIVELPLFFVMFCGALKLCLRRFCCCYLMVRGMIVFVWFAEEGSLCFRMMFYAPINADRLSDRFNHVISEHNNK